MAQLSVFGSLDLREDGRRVDVVLSQPKRAALLVYLAAARPHGFHSRDTLLALFWPESDARRARRALRKALHFLRKHLGKDTVVSRGDDLGLAGVDCDAAAFDEAVAAGRSREALELYRGEFLKGFHVSRAPEFERWLDAANQRYRRAAARLAWSLSEGELASGSAIEAARFARRAHAIQPLEEMGVRRLMELLDRLGDRAAALRVFEQAEKRIRAELGVELGAETRALQAEIATRTTALGTDDTVDGSSARHRRSREPSESPEAPDPKDETRDAQREKSRAPPPPPPVATGSSRGGRTRHVTVGAISALLVLFAIGVFFGPGRSEEPLDPGPSAGSAIAVLPFTVAGEEELAWREDMAILFSTSLHGAAGLRAREPEYVLKLWESEFDGAAPTRALIRTAGRRLNTDWLVSGSMATANERLRLTAEARNVANGRSAGPVVVEGRRDSLFSLVDHLTVELLRDGVIADEERALPVELSRVTTSSLAALEAYLEGERQWRSARLRKAADAFAQAVRHDSTFALARYRLAIAQYWNGGGDPLEHLRAAVRSVDRLHDREAMLARGWLALQEGRIEEGLDLLHGLTNRHPEFAEGWLRLGDGILHNGGRLLVPMSEFRTSLRQAIEKNPLAAEPYWHLLEDAFFREDSAEAGRLVDAYRRVDPYSPACIGYVTAYELAWGDEASHDRAVERLPRLDAEVRGPLNCALSVLDRAAPLRPAMELVADEMESPVRPEADRRQARPNRIRLAIRAGSIREARELLRRYYAEGEDARGQAAATMLLLEVLGYPDPAARREAARVLAEDPSPIDQFWLAAAELEHGKPNSVTDRVAALRRAADSLEGQSAVQANELARALELLQRLEAGQAGDLRALSHLQAHLPGPSPGHPGSRMVPFVRQTIRLRIAEALLDKGEPDEALRYVQSLPMHAYALNAPAFLLEGRAYEAMADTLAAQASYSRFLRWYEHADPELEPAKEQAREGLRRLGLFDR